MLYAYPGMLAGKACSSAVEFPKDEMCEGWSDGLMTSSLSSAWGPPAPAPARQAPPHPSLCCPKGFCLSFLVFAAREAMVALYSRAVCSTIIVRVARFLETPHSCRSLSGIVERA